MPYHVARAFTLLLLVTPLPGARAQSAAQTITIAVNAINQIAFVGSPTLAITTATAGSAPTSAIDATATWAVTTNQTGAKITASIPTVMPAGSRYRLASRHRPARPARRSSHLARRRSTW